MKKSKTPANPELADNDRDAIEKAAAALSAFDDVTQEDTGEDVQEEMRVLSGVLDDGSHDFLEDVKQVSEEMAIWEEGDPETESEEPVLTAADSVNMEDTELAQFESADIEDVQFLSEDQIQSVIESVLFATDKPVSAAFFRQIFRGTNVKAKEIRSALSTYASDLASQRRGVGLEEVATGYQLRTKLDNGSFLRGSVKARPFKLSGPALETLSIVAYKQPVTKAQIDEIRGVESGHLLRALMEKNLVSFGEKSELPGKPMYYETTRRFLEIFGLRNVRELPSLHEIDQLIPEGIGDDEKKETLGDLTEQLSQELAASYSEGEEELHKISDELDQISTSSEFFEQEKQRLKDKRDLERAQDIREAIALGDKVEDKDVRWLERFDEAQLLQAKGDSEVNFVATDESVTSEEAPSSHALE